jgi:hypothetical protein
MSKIHNKNKIYGKFLYETQSSIGAVKSARSLVVDHEKSFDIAVCIGAGENRLPSRRRSAIFSSHLAAPYCWCGWVHSWSLLAPGPFRGLAIVAVATRRTRVGSTV